MLQQIVILLVASFFGSTSAACSGLNKMPNFNATLFLGVWYEAGNFNSIRDNTKGFPFCMATNLVTNGQGDYRMQRKEIINFKNYNGDVKTRTQNFVGDVSFNVNDNDKETMSIRYKSADNNFGSFFIPTFNDAFYVIDTDYSSYAIVARCTRLSDSITILTRSKNIAATSDKTAVNNKITASLANYGLNQCDFQFVSNECIANY